MAEKKWKQEDNFWQEDYDEEKMCKAMDDYLEQCIDEWEVLKKSYSEKWESYQNVLKTKIPTVPGFILYVLKNKIRKKLWRETLYRRAKDENKFPWWKDRMDILMISQQDRLIQGTSSWLYNPIIWKLLLSQHGIHEKTIVETQESEAINEDDLED